MLAGTLRSIGPVDLGEASPTRAGQLAASAARRAELFLRSEGYYAARAQAALSDGGAITIQIEPGARFLVDRVEHRFEGSTGRRPDVKQSVLSTGDPVRAQSVLDAEAAGLAWLHENGWPDARIAERRVVVDHDRTAAGIVLAYAPGAHISYSGLYIGQSPLRAGFVDRLNPFEAGEPVTRSGLRQFEQRLQALEGVRAATLTTPGGGDGRIAVSAEPAPKHAVELGLSLSTSDGAGMVGSWSRRNLRGGDETLTLTGELATLRQGFDVSVRSPHWRRLDQTLTGVAGIQSEVTDAFNQEEVSLEARVTRRLRASLTAGFGARLGLSSISDTAGRREIASAAFGTSLVHDNRDSALDPQTGWRGTILAIPATAFGDVSTRFLKLDVSASTYRRISDQVTLAARIRLGGITGADALDLPADDRFYAGGGGSVRGFEYQSLSPRDATGAIIGGRSLGEVSVEARWRGSGSWGGVVFVDAGSAQISSTPQFGDIGYAIGVGARYNLGFAPLRVDVALPLSGQADNPQLYISLGQAF